MDVKVVIKISGLLWLMIMVVFFGKEIFLFLEHYCEVFDHGDQQVYQQLNKEMNSA